MSYPKNTSLIIIIIIIIIVIIIIINFFKKMLLLLKKNHRYDLKSKIKNYKNLGQACLILLLIL
jgi:flagellar basal body-associated protein FliL